MANPLVIKQAIRDLLVTALPDFTVTWGFGQKNPPKSWCYIGDMTWPEAEWATNRSRQYQVSMPIVLNVVKSRTSAEQVEVYLAEQYDAIEAAFSADSTLRSLGVVTWGMAPRMYGSQPHVDGVEGQAVIELQVTYRP